MTKWMDSKK